MTDSRDGTPAITIRPELPGDVEAVFGVEAAAFGQPNEARIVDAVRGGADEVASLVAIEGERLVAHVFFSRVRIDGLSRASAVALGPVAVVPDRQGLKIGDALIRRGIDVIRSKAAFDLLFVLGNPRYYARFGFRPANAIGYEYAPGMEHAFQYIWLRGWPGSGGRVVYHPAFGGEVT